jgi:IS1 family transposase
LELDELWSFVRRRSNKRWVWLALCRRTRQVVAYAIGKRGEATCRLLWERILLRLIAAACSTATFGKPIRRCCPKPNTSR